VRGFWGFWGIGGRRRRSGFAEDFHFFAVGVGVEDAGPAAVEDFGDAVIEGSGPKDFAFEGFELHLFAVGEARDPPDDDLDVGGRHEGLAGNDQRGGIVTGSWTGNDGRVGWEASCEVKIIVKKVGERWQRRGRADSIRHGVGARGLRGMPAPSGRQNRRCRFQSIV